MLQSVGFLNNTRLLIASYFFLVNLVSFLFMGIDKLKAKHDAYRIPEAVLFLLSAIGGSIGSLLGMFLFHHKTRKAVFRIGMPLILILQVLFICFLVFCTGVEIR